MAGASEPRLRWCSAAVLVAGPEVDLPGADKDVPLISLGDSGPLVADVSVVEDGRMHMAVSGLCLAADGSPPVVLTAAAALAPFLVRRSDGRGSPSHLRTTLAPELVTTTEIFVVFPEEDPNSVGVSVPATVVACLPVRDAERMFGDLQTASAGNKSASSKAQCSGPDIPALAFGSLGLAILRLAADLSEEFLNPFSILQSAAAAAAIRSGHGVRILASPFGALKPSLFMHSEVPGSVASVHVQTGLLFLDARCLPGTEGGVLVTSQSSSSQGTPVALVASPLRGSSGERGVLGAGLLLSAVCRAVTGPGGIPPGLLDICLGSQLHQAFLSMAEESISGAVSSRSLLNVPTVHHDSGKMAVGRCVFIASSPILGKSSLALALSRRGHILVHANFVEEVAAAQQQLSKPSGKSKISLTVETAAGLEHVNAEILLANGFSLADNPPALLHLTDGLPSGVEVLRFAQTSDLETGSEILALDLSDDTKLRWSTGVIGRSIFAPEKSEQGAMLLSCSFSSSASRALVIASAGPEPLLLGLALGGTHESDLPMASAEDAGVLPHHCLALHAAQLGPIQRIFEDPVSDQGRVEDLAAWDLSWRNRAQAGASQLVWRVEAGAARPRMASL